MSPRPKTTIAPAVFAYAEAAVAAKPEPDPIVIRDSAPVLIEAPPCALESAPVGAKCIVSRTDGGKKVRLLTPQGVTELGTEDVFYTLPAGAKVRKASESSFVAYRLGQGDAPVFEATSAREAVTRFLKLVA